MVFLIMGSVCLAWIHVSVSVLLGWVGGLEAIVFGSIRWCVWSFRPSSPLRLPHLKCLLLLFTLWWKLVEPMGYVLPGYMFRYQYCLVGGLEAIVFGSIRWCVWSVRPSSPLRLPHLKCLLLLLIGLASQRAGSTDLLATLAGLRWRGIQRARTTSL